MNIRNYYPWPGYRSGFFQRIYPPFFFLAVLVILLIVLPPGVNAEERVLVNYSFVDENSVSVWDPPVRISQYGLSKGLVAYHKGQTIYIWDSKTGERKKLEIPPESNYNIDIGALDITDGTVYYVLNKKKGRSLFGSEGGLYSYDGINNTVIPAFSRHDILNIIADNNRILIHDVTDYFKPSDSGQDSAGDLLVYSPENNGIIPVDDLIELSDPIGFGGNYSVTKALGICVAGCKNMTPRLPMDGLAVFSLPVQPHDRTVTQIRIPSGTDIKPSEERVGFDPDCFSEHYFVWKKTTGNSTSGYHSILYLTDLRTQKSIVLTETDGYFSDYSYAVDNDYVLYGRTLYHIPGGNRTVLSFNGDLDKLFDSGLSELKDNRTSEIDIVRFNDGGILLRTYPRMEDVDYSGTSRLFFADLTPVIHPGEKARTPVPGNIPVPPQQNAGRETPVSLMIPGFALIAVGIFVIYRNR
jgi:hypothetical protein